MLAENVSASADYTAHNYHRDGKMNAHKAAIVARINGRIVRRLMLTLGVPDSSPASPRQPIVQNLSLNSIHARRGGPGAKNVAL
jgi:hypothetical protein